LKQGVVLFAHGSRDAEWARPFRKLAAVVSNKLPDAEVRLAYLEQMQPPLAQAIKELVEKNCATIRVVPVFLGQGGHVRNDLPTMVSAIQGAYPHVKFLLEPPIGEQASVIEAIASAISAGTHSSH
jgi:sirohydrochlorin cobaltochelatase